MTRSRAVTFVVLAGQGQSFQARHGAMETASGEFCWGASYCVPRPRDQNGQSTRYVTLTNWPFEPPPIGL